MRLILVRHGETIENQMGICQGQMDGTLSENGIYQAKRVAEHIKGWKLNAIYSSDLKRATDTATEIITFFPEIPFFQDLRIRERYFGSLQGNKFPENKKCMNIPKDAESDEELFRRVSYFVNEIKKMHFMEDILIISHGVTIRMILAIIQNQSPSSIQSIQEVNNGSITDIEFDKDNSLKITLFNSIEHLST